MIARSFLNIQKAYSSFMLGGNEFKRSVHNLKSNEGIAFHRHPTTEEWIILKWGSLTITTKKKVHTFTASNGRVMTIYMPAKKLHSLSTPTEVEFISLHEFGFSTVHVEPSKRVPLRFMIIDRDLDDQPEGRAMKDILTQYGAQFEVLKRGKDAVAKLQRDPDRFDVILLGADSRGRLDSPLVLEDIRKFDREIPVISIASTDVGHRSVLAKKMEGQSLCQGFILKSDWKNPEMLQEIRGMFASCTRF